uniref:Uncharacterized protein n=1 Tax=Mucochytrium quahogii TaxID=96639 RepID=A0A7S2RJ65_9STRA|mmetsp:Transcript_20715/g.34188  ORF Transcript_20715/g.34188 Transcript_20715/m.34188 type:complete len:934 (-) Transcript_20715:68-2869(-)|eukprot:CAMPEP_0203749004 /NCGR_PEP_ID=MMETSP0098-20131031/3714_1 /ASSEMBLY_ACC=CAM_ASM_000208 /TAXON_ID=96639 /ORGANISM=" , Strain NY0313808BC1" /LENGTH=933 /DNA_ID=CAMNT_0050637933 /DNA_START=282 /DNA_END=3083 /DNA_ORIENTATION=-
MDRFHYGRFRNEMEKALVTVRKIVGAEKEPVYPSELSHEYGDKYLLVERAANSSLMACMTSLEMFGLSKEQLGMLKNWAKSGKTVTLVLTREETSEFDRKEEVKQDGKTTKVSTFMGVKHTEKIVTTITDYHWKFSVKYKLFVYPGNDKESALTLKQENRCIGLKTQTDTNPRPPSLKRHDICVEVSHLLLLVDDAGYGTFKVDRSVKTCRTPRRNEDVEKLEQKLQQVSSWCTRIKEYFGPDLQMAASPNGERPGLFAAVSPEEVFVPVVPLFAYRSKKDEAKNGASLMTLGDVDAFMSEHRKELLFALEKVVSTFDTPPKNDQEDQTEQVLGVAEVQMTLLADHLDRICMLYSTCIDYIEQMLYQQLREAIGKHIDVRDFTEYMRYHYRKMYAHDLGPKPFSYDVRREGYSPQGTVSIEYKPDEPGSKTEEILTTSRRRSREDAVPMKFQISAATQVYINGPQYIHGYISHKFSHQSPPGIRLVSRARQFSSFVLLVGRVVSRDTFKPSHAIVLHNKDEVILSLILDPLPTPKAFRDAIESLSPEQQEFAKAFRKMQLESTLFGVCVVQIKPQLEALLNLPQGALTKEIKLTQDLMRLFMEYQVPSDLLTFDGEETTSLEDKLSRVKSNTAAVLDMIEKSREEDLKRGKEAAENAIYNAVEECDADIDCVASVESPGAPTLFGSSQVMKKKSAGFGSRGGPQPRSLATAGLFGGGGAAPQMMRCAAAPPPPPVPYSANVSFAANAAQVQQQLHADQAPPTKHTVIQPHEDKDDSSEPTTSVDYTAIPAQLDAKFENLDTDAALRPTTIKVHGCSRSRQKNLISKPTESTLYDGDLRLERAKAMDLIDAISRSGELALVESSFHVIVAATHCFDETVIDTVVKQNQNPIESIERSSLIVASTIQDTPVASLLAPSASKRIRLASPQLFNMLE